LLQPPKNLESFESLLKIVEDLRGPQGCPWDKEQTHRTLTPFAIEESHELAEAVEAGDQDEMISELGDVLLQVVLHAEIGRQEKRFDIHDVIRAISEKMVFRHPHVYGDVSVGDSTDVLANWSKLKEQEKAKKAKKTGAISGNVFGKETSFGVSPALPALQRSQKIGDKTKSRRFDWDNASEVMVKVDEEIAELKAEIAKGSVATREELEHEVGDVLFSVAQIARHLGLEAEQCLRVANSRFEKRFFTMKNKIEESGRNYDSLTKDELEIAWKNR
jgi:tetrapyrrole methylase family protein / MazG family protein